MTGVRETFNRLQTNACFDWWPDCFENAEKAAVVEYNVHGHDGGIWHVVLDNHDPACTVHEGPAEAPDLQLALSSADWLDIVAGRSSPWSLLASGPLIADGDRQLIGPLGLLGLLGPPVTADGVKAQRDQHWLADAPFFVAPRVLSAGKVDHAKWRYFADQGQLKMRPSRITWRALLEAKSSWRRQWLRGILLPGLVGSASLTVPAALILGLLVPPLRWWLPLALLTCAIGAALIFVFWFAIAALSRAEEVVTRLACEDSDFFHFAIRRRLVKIVPAWQDK